MPPSDPLFPGKRDAAQAATETPIDDAESAIALFDLAADLGGTPSTPEFDENLEVVGTVGRGGMGVIYRARERKLGRTVALKVLGQADFAGPEERRRFQLEAEAAGNLRHPNIVPIYEVGEADGVPWYTMPLLGGGTLLDKLGGGALPGREAATLLLPVVRAVEFAHQRGILHRDIKPANILIDDDGVPVVADFGLAKAVARSRHTLSGAVLGSPNYMPPEQARGDVATTASDVYSLGAVLYHLLAGRAPFVADTPLETMRQVVEKVPDPPSRSRASIDGDLETICLKCLEKSPSHRYCSAGELAADLQRWLDGKAIAARRSSTLARLAKWARRKPAWAALVATCALAAAVFVAMLLVNQTRLQRERDTTEGVRRSAEDLVGRALTDYRDTVESTVGRLGALDELSDSVGDYFEALPEGLRDARSELLRAQLLTLRGEISAESQDRGGLARAAELIGQALVLCEGRESTDWERVETRALIRRAEIALDQDDPIARAFAARAIANAERLGERGLPEAGRLLGLALFQRGRTSSKAGDPGAAEADYRRSLGFARSYYEANPGAVRAAQEFVWSMVKLAQLQKSRGLGLRQDLAARGKAGTEAERRALSGRAEALLAESRDLYDRAGHLLRELLERKPWLIHLRKDLGVVSDGLGDLAADGFADFDAAVRHYRDYAEQAEVLVAHDPENATWLAELAIAKRSIAGAIVAGGAPGAQGDALALFDESITLRQRMAAADASDLRLRRKLCDTWIDRGKAARGFGQLEEARKSFAAAEALAVDHSARDAEGAWWRNRQISIALRLAALDFKSAPSEARRRLMFAIDLGRELHRTGELTAPGMDAYRAAQQLLEAVPEDDEQK